MSTRGRNRTRNRAATAAFGGPSYDAEASSYFTRAGITDADAQTAINTFIVGVKEDFAITLLDEVFDQLVLQANESAAAAVVDMTANEMDQLLVNSPTFTQWRGVTNTGGTNYSNTRFTPSTDGVRFAQNSKTYGFCLRSFTGAGSISYGLIDGTYQSLVYLDDGGGSYQFRDHVPGSGGVVVANSGNTTGHFALSRTASNLFAAYRDGASLGTNTSASVSLATIPYHTHGVNNGGAHVGVASGMEVAFSYFARGMSSGEMTAFDARVQTLKTAIGW